MKRYRILKTTVIALIVIVLAAVVGGWTMFRTQLRAANTIRKLEDDFYYMEYVGDYGFSDFLKQGGADSDEELANYIAGFLSHGFYRPNPQKGTYGCSTIDICAPEGDALFGRNFDWQNCTAMVVTTRPRDGYASISTCNLDFLGFGEGWLPEGVANKVMALAAVYVPLDGMNEKGLCVADLVIDDGTQTNQKTDKPELTTTSAIRLLLDRAATVNEAVALLEQYDMNSSAGMQHHLAISDEEGRSVVVEYVEDNMIVTDAKVVTNFYLAAGDHFGVGSEQSQYRYEYLRALLEDCGGVMTEEEVMKALEMVSQKNYNSEYDATQWSVVFNKSDGTAEYCLREEYTKSYTFHMSKKQ